MTFAVEAEFGPWRKSRKFVARRIGNVPRYTTKIGAATVDVVLTGMGPENARRAVEAALSPEHVVCISSGFAGALTAEYQVADVLVAAGVRQSSDDRTIASDEPLVKSALQTNGAAEVKNFVSVESVVETPEEKADLAKFGAAVEMESHAILAVARSRAVPAVAIRAISDRFDQKLPMDFSGTVDQCGHVRDARTKDGHPSASISSGGTRHAADRRRCPGAGTCRANRIESEPIERRRTRRDTASQDTVFRVFQCFSVEYLRGYPTAGPFVSEVR